MVLHLVLPRQLVEVEMKIEDKRESLLSTKYLDMANVMLRI